MPNCYRRGGTYHRNGKTFTRRGTSIRRPAAGLAIGLASIAAITGGASVGSPILIAGVSLAIVGYVIYRNRNRLAPIGNKLLKRAEKRYSGRNTRPVLAARIPAPKPRRAAPTAKPGTFNTTSETWNTNRFGKTTRTNRQVKHTYQENV